MSSMSLKVQNVKCGGCVSAIQNGLSDMTGIDNVEVEIASGEVTIEGNELDQAAITQKLAELGYPVTE